ncbi:MAG: ABC transporter permease [Actinobacteria bacterium]|nr:MAG: ABC transporter permease [Actinomycetota bacterium]
MPVPIATKTLFERKLRFALSTGGVALSIMLILILNGLSAGVADQVTAYLDNQTASLIVSQKGLRNFLGATSIIPSSTADPVREVPGVRSAVPVIVQYVVLDLPSRKEFSLLVGFDRRQGGGPWSMRQGTADIAGDEAIFDAVVAGRHDIEAGDEVQVLGREFKVAGLSGGTSSWMTGTFFVTFDAASELLATRGNPSFLLVRLDSGASASRVIRDIEAETGLTVTRKSVMNANDVKLYLDVFQGPVNLMVGIAFLIGVVLVGMTIYTATVERAKQYGALKAIGIRNGRLYLIVLGQALIASIAGFVLGVGLAFAVRALLGLVTPQFLIVFDYAAIARLSLVALAISLAASYLPVRALAGIDPAIAFKRGV